MQNAREPKTSAVIVAAGRSSRMGEFKPLLELGGLSFVRRTIANFRQAGAAPIVLVGGYRVEELEKHVAGEGVLCLRNMDYAGTEMIDSAKVGLGYVADKSDRTFFSPVDVPLVRASTVRRMMDRHESIVRPVYGGSSGHPVLLDNALIAQILNWTGDLGRFLNSQREHTCFLEVPDQGILLDADTPADYRELVEMHNRQLFRPRLEISLWGNTRILDARTALLLRVIDYDGTVKEACGRLGISYRTAWNVLGETETALGMPLVERNAGGEYGGMSRLTPEGEELLEKYECFAKRMNSYAKECFADVFGEVPKEEG